MYFFHVPLHILHVFTSTCGSTCAYLCSVCVRAPCVCMRMYGCLISVYPGCLYVDEYVCVYSQGIHI